MRRVVNHRHEELEEQLEQQKGFATTLDAVDELLEDNERLQQENKRLEQDYVQVQEENEQLRVQLQEEKERNTKLNMQLNEMSKMTASVAGKASEEEVQKALRVFVNKSKRKRLDKRIAIKEMVLELANANGLVLPEDLAAVIDSLDDEQPPVDQPQVNVTESLAPLFTAEAQQIWQRLQDAGFIVPGGYALAEGISANQAAYIADRMAEKLQLKKKWKLFQQLWGISNMAQLAGSWQQTGKLPPRSSEIDKLME